MCLTIHPECKIEGSRNISSALHTLQTFKKWEKENKASLQSFFLKKKKKTADFCPLKFHECFGIKKNTPVSHLCRCAVLHQYIHQCLHTLKHQFIRRQIFELQLKFTSYSARVELLNWKWSHYFQSKRTPIVRIYEIIHLNTHNKRLSYGHVEYVH